MPPPADPTTIEGVLAALDASHRRGRSRNAAGVDYFAAIYRKVTAKVAEGIASGFFDDAERIQRLDVTFANRYLAALRLFQTGGTSTKSWEITLRPPARRGRSSSNTSSWRSMPTINLDLGIAAARPRLGRCCPTCAGTSIG